MDRNFNFVAFQIQPLPNTQIYVTYGISPTVNLYGVSSKKFAKFLWNQFSGLGNAEHKNLMIRILTFVWFSYLILLIIDFDFWAGLVYLVVSIISESALTSRLTTIYLSY